MDESGGSGQPRSGTNEPTEHATGATTPAADPGTPEPKHADSDRPGPGTSAQAPEDRKDTSTSPEEREGAGVVPESHEEASTSLEHPTRDGDAEPGTRSVPAADDRTESGSPAEPAEPAESVKSAEDGDAEPETPSRPSAPTPHDRTDTGTAHDPTPTPSAPAPPALTRLNGEPKSGGAPTGGDHDADRAPSHPHHPYAHTDPGARTGTDATTPRTDPAIAKGRPPHRPKEPGGGLLMGRPFGVPVYVAPSWFLVAALITWVFGGQLDRVLPELGAARYLVSLFFAVAFYASVLVHELAHTVAALRFKLPVRRIQLQFFGGVSEIEKEAETPGREFVLAFVGPLLSLILSGIFYLAMLPVEPGTVPGVLLAGLMVSNLIVAAFNLLPGLPLDGGRMLRAVVWKITGRPMSGTIAAAWVGRALAVSVLIGLPLLTQTGALGTNTEDINGMDTVTDALLAAILAAIIWTGAGNSLRMARLREHLPELRARNLTRRAVPVETSTPLSEALRRANAAGARALVVVDADGQPLSLVREAAIVNVPEHRRPWVSVSGLAQDLTDGMRVSAELAGEDLLDALRATPATEYLVVEETGEIYGVLSAADVERAFVKAMARPN
ncbi:site-2 protease family protein [Streptomyces sp. NPDC088350]|uniref:site-2 protease family protein n=1 Tax=Streptomyces sp. NPDC088350 TaxID=3365854 RepID=UPI00381EC7F7